MKLPEKYNSAFAQEPRAGVATATSMRCLSHGYLDGSARCERCIPQDVIEAAWRRALEDGTSGEGFFRVERRDGQWLAYGHSDGSVHGLYCPEHAAERDQRAVGAIARADAAVPAAQFA
jgi:hypothetical protein